MLANAVAGLGTSGEVIGLTKLNAGVFVSPNLIGVSGFQVKSLLSSAALFSVLAGTSVTGAFGCDWVAVSAAGWTESLLGAATLLWLLLKHKRAV